jgi:hypothetical protein
MLRVRAISSVRVSHLIQFAMKSLICLACSPLYRKSRRMRWRWLYGEGSGSNKRLFVKSPQPIQSQQTQQISQYVSFYASVSDGRIKKKGQKRMSKKVNPQSVVEMFNDDLGCGDWLTDTEENKLRQNILCEVFVSLCMYDDVCLIVWSLTTVTLNRFYIASHHLDFSTSYLEILVLVFSFIYRYDDLARL